MKTHLSSGFAAAVILLLSACEAMSPNLDAAFGDSVRAAQARQTLNPDAPKNTRVMTRLEGTAAQNTLHRYRDSFKEPPPPPSLFTINVGGGGGGAGGK